MNIMIINGPNLNLLGIREPSIYGSCSFDEYLEELKASYSAICDIFFYQSNHEGDIIDKLHETGFSYDGIILNAGGYSHTSVAIHDTIKSITTPVIEVHISNIFRREEFRHKSIITAACKGSVTGLGLESYRLALEYFIKI